MTVLKKVWVFSLDLEIWVEPERDMKWHSKQVSVDKKSKSMAKSPFLIGSSNIITLNFVVKQLKAEKSMGTIAYLSIKAGSSH